MSFDAEKVRETAAAWSAEGRALACVTVVRTWRSSPRPVGSLMVVDEDGRFAGSVSGGCVESEVLEQAVETIRDRRPRRLSYGVTNDRAWEVGLPCGGTMEVFVAPLDTEINRRLVQAAGDRSLHALTTDLDTGVQRLFDPDDRPADLSSAVGDFLERAGFGEAAELVEDGDRRVFAQVLGPPVHLILVGAVHLGQLVAELGLTAGFRVTVVDPRRAFATPERFPRVALRYEWPAEALAALGIDRRTAVVTLSHDEKIDEPALAAALRSDCFYIGALGGRKSQTTRRERLRAGGFDERALERIHGPVGLDIGARTTPEIAVSIVAEIIGSWRGHAVTGRLAPALRTDG